MATWRIVFPEMASHQCRWPHVSNGDSRRLIPDVWKCASFVSYVRVISGWKSKLMTYVLLFISGQALKRLWVSRVCWLIVWTAGEFEVIYPKETENDLLNHCVNIYRIITTLSSCSCFIILLHVSAACAGHRKVENPKIIKEKYMLRWRPPLYS
jgi:hypothetical protein